MNLVVVHTLRGHLWNRKEWQTGRCQVRSYAGGHEYHRDSHIDLAFVGKLVDKEEDVYLNWGIAR